MRVSGNQCQDSPECGTSFHEPCTESPKHETSRTRTNGPDTEAVASFEKEMYYHVGERSRFFHGDYRHHPLVSIFTSALMIPLPLHTSHSILNSCRVHQPLLGVSFSLPPPLPASSHRAPYMISCFFFHAATEHSDLTHL